MVLTFQVSDLGSKIFFLNLKSESKKWWELHLCLPHVGENIVALEVSIAGHGFLVFPKVGPLLHPQVLTSLTGSVLFGQGPTPHVCLSN